MKKIMFIVALAIALTGPSCSTQQEAQTPEPSNVIFEDDFSSSDTGWEIIDFPVGSAGYRDGYYFVVGQEIGINMYGAAQREFSDFTVEVDATQVSGPDNNSYGVICRLQPEDIGYYFFISGDGYFSLFVVGVEYTPLVEWTASNAIQQGEATNHVLVGCVGDHLTMEVNGEPLIDVHDSTYTGGDLGLVATTYEEGTSVEIHYDNLVLRKP